MSIEAMKQALEALEAVYGESCDAIHALRTAIQQAESEPVEISPEFTDTARAALLWVLWHHQGGSSPVGQPIRYALGMGAHDHLNDHQVIEAKRWASITGAQTSEFHTHPAPGVPDALKDHQIAAMVNTLRDIARQFHGHDSLRERIANVLVPALKAEANADEPVAWIRRHPNGALSNELLIHVQVEQVRRDSGAWVPLYTHPAPGVPDDAKRLNWLDDTNKRFRMGWEVGQAPAGNVSIRTIITGGKSIRDAIDAAMLTAARAQKGGAA